MRSVGIWSFALGVLFSSTPGCSSNKSDCACLVERGNERRSVVCGQSACVAGTLEICSETGQIVERGACNPAPPSTEQPDTGGSGGSSCAAPDHSCDDLLSFCNSSCNSPTTASTDCQNTASSGDSAACQQWQQTNAVVCRP